MVQEGARLMLPFVLGGNSLLSERKRGEPQGIPLLHALSLAELKLKENEKK